MSTRAESAAEVEPTARMTALMNIATAAHSLLKVVHW
jgi:hypothetical protein